MNEEEEEEEEAEGEEEVMAMLVEVRIWSPEVSLCITTDENHHHRQKGIV